MKFPAFVTRLAAGLRTKANNGTLSAVNSRGGWFSVIRESFAGAFQAAIEIDPQTDLLANSSIFSPLTLIAGDISKMRVKLVEEDDDGIASEVKRNSPYLPVLRKPNRYQNRIRFWEHWTLSKLLYGNTYALKQRDARGIVTALHILHAERVTPLVAESGDVYYQVKADHLSRLTADVTLPASEIIHDRMNCIWHPLVGVSPIYAAALSASMGRKIQGNSYRFFQNLSRPGGMLTAPATIDQETAKRLKDEFEANFGGDKLGRLFVGGDGLKYEPMTIPAEQAQLIQQLEWTAKDIAACFHMPLFKVGGPIPPNNTVEALQLQYYSDCLQALIESAELCLDEGLELKDGYSTEFDLDALMRMDSTAHITMLAEGVKAAIMAPNEARKRRNLKPVAGGDSPYLQQQNYSLEALAKRDALPDPFATSRPAPTPAPTSASAQEPAKDYTLQLLADIAAEAKAVTPPRITTIEEVAHA